MMSTGTKVFFGFLAGAVAGFTAGILLAPRSGKETRKIIAESSGELFGDLSESINGAWKRVGQIAEANTDKEKDNI